MQITKVHKFDKNIEIHIEVKHPEIESAVRFSVTVSEGVVDNMYIYHNYSYYKKLSKKEQQEMDAFIREYTIKRYNETIK